jgi:hypothetical protein
VLARELSRARRTLRGEGRLAEIERGRAKRDELAAEANDPETLRSLDEIERIAIHLADERLLR